MIKKENTLMQITMTPTNMNKLEQIQKDLEKTLGIALTKSKTIAYLIANYKLATEK